MEFFRDDDSDIVEWGDDDFDIQMLMATPNSSDWGETAQDSIMQEENCEDADPEKKVSNTDISEETSPLGLSLTKTPSLLDSVHKILNQENVDVPTNSRQTTKSRGPNVPKDERKAVNFPAKLIMIGPWKMRSRNQGDIVVKFYIAKEKLLWEILQDGLKKKIQFLWDDISAISAVFLNEKGSNLEVELKRQPAFYQEIDPLPRRPTYWETIKDFTNGSASKWRRHYLEFDKGVLEKHYEKLLRHNPPLLALSQKPFCCNSPFFQSINLRTFNCPFAAKLPFDEKSAILPHLSNGGDIYTPTPQIGILPSDEKSVILPHLSNGGDIYTPTSQIGILPSDEKSAILPHLSNGGDIYTPTSQIGILPSEEKFMTLPHLSNEGDIYTPTSQIGILASHGSSIDANYQFSGVKPEPHIMQMNPPSSVNSLASVNCESWMYSLSNMPQFSNQNSQTMSYDDAMMNHQIQQSSNVYTTGAPIYPPPQTFSNLATYSNELNSLLLEQFHSQ
ncbi:uncharacterized protein [Typha latifolia]|uniref:uncharacterized protein n=1 Tax=Typha latifolia TaxID=4733 RepID=UPI003C2BB77E